MHRKDVICTKGLEDGGREKGKRIRQRLDISRVLYLFVVSYLIRGQRVLVSTLIFYGGVIRYKRRVRRFLLSSLTPARSRDCKDFPDRK